MRSGFWIGLFLCVCLSLSLSPASAKPSPPREHVVAKGQRLGSIAKRYNVSIEALCRANGIERRDPIHPGQRLVIPRPGEPLPPPPPEDSKASKDEKAKDPEPGEPRVHTVYKGQRLGSIAKRYNVTVDLICKVNGITRRSAIHPGQRLVIPATDDTDGARAMAARKRLLAKNGRASPGKEPSWKKYTRLPRRRGYLKVSSPWGSFEGYVIGRGNVVLPKARNAIAQLMALTEGRPSVPNELVMLIAKVSDKFGGRPVRLVSGYREHSYARDSRHKYGRAIDFRIEGVPNQALSDYLRTLPGLGVGYYPNSTFVHADVRSQATYWIDDSGPGEPPRYRRIEAASR